ncbi:MAG: hypothetical protein ACRDSJ_05615 [Rubrobacteraceae bacterium]
MESRGRASAANDFVGTLGEAFREASKSGVEFTAGGSDLEWERFNRHPFDETEEGRRDSLDPFEHSPVIARHPGEPEGVSRLEYFLDGVQATEEIGRIGTVPVVVTTVAACIVKREDRRIRRFDVGGVPQLLRAIILPHNADDPGANALYEAVQNAGMPLVERDGEAISAGHTDLLVDSTYHEPYVDPSDYSGLKSRAYNRARSLREALETELLRRWSEMETGTAWIAVDGQLPLPIKNAVGLVKNARRLFFGGEEARMLLDLESGHRTTAFVPPWRAERRDSGRKEEERASWYVRLWPADAGSEGADATSGLVRVESVVPGTSNAENTPIFDEVSRWILAERAPLAKPDPRWMSMIYPIGYVENILKPTIHGNRRARLRLEREIATLQGG